MGRGIYWVGFIAFILVLLFLSSGACRAESADRHYCEDGHFSFVPPADWRIFNTDYLSGKIKNKLYRIGKDLQSCPASGALMTICTPETGRIFRHQLILIYRSYLEGKPDIEIENNWSSEKYLNKKNKQLYSTDYFNPDITANIEIEDAKCYYQKDIHTAFEEVTGTLNGEDFVRITATVLGGRTKTTLFCQVQDNAKAEIVDLIMQIVNSFEYEVGYEFGNPDIERTYAGTRNLRTAKELLIQFCICSLLLFVGLSIYRIVSGDYIPIAAMITATVLSMLLFVVFRWQGYLPYISAIVVMVLVIWKWPTSEISLKKSITAVCSLFFILSLIPGVLMAMGAGVAIIPFIAVILVLIILAWRKSE